MKTEKEKENERQKKRKLKSFSIKINLIDGIFIKIDQNFRIIDWFLTISLIKFMKIFFK